MELAANDLCKHINARKGSRKPYLSLRCIRHIMHQLLSAIAYIHNKGYTHRDLKPTNILVTQWDPKTNLPTVKLADFGLAGIRSNLSSLCGTPKYWAPEIVEEEARRERNQKLAGRGFKTVHRPFHYDNSVDIWTLGRILVELLEDIPNETRLRGKTMVVNKQPAMQLAQCMMSILPKDRPNASACLQHTWLTENNPTVCKRDRSPTPGKAVVLPSKRILFTAGLDPNVHGSDVPGGRSGNSDAIPLTISSCDTSTRRLAASIERALITGLTSTTSTITDIDVRLDRSTEPV